MTTTQEAADRMLKDSRTFTIRKDGEIAGMRWWMPGIFRTLANNMLTADEPHHTRLRSIVDEAFRRRAILDMEPRILAIADELAAELFARRQPRRPRRPLRTQAAAIGDLRAARPAERRPAEVHDLGRQHDRRAEHDRLSSGA